MKKSNFYRFRVSSSNQSSENVLKEYKKKVGKVIYVAISARTTIELPADLTQEEIDTRVEHYKKLHPSRI